MSTESKVVSTNTVLSTTVEMEPSHLPKDTEIQSSEMVNPKPEVFELKVDPEPTVILPEHLDPEV